jgi:predicted RNA-binding Zn ribbon-like protein
VNATAGRRAPQFELMGGPACLDFVNTLDDRFSAHPQELLDNYCDLARFAEDTRLLTPQQAHRLYQGFETSPQDAQRALQSAIRMREALSEVFYSRIREQPVPKASLGVLNHYLQEAAQQASLVPGKGRFEWQFDSLEDLEAPLWLIARSAAELLASEQLQFVRACASKTCEWLFLDESKNHRRRWCDMTKCGNRAKVRNFYSRKKTSSS